MTNDYKPDTGKPPVMDAVFIPYRRTILAIAAMKADMAIKHKLQGAKDPFMEWVQLPDAKRRLANAGARHALQPWTPNLADGRHLHIIHAIVGLMMAAEIHLTDLEKVTEMVTPPPAPEPLKCYHLGGIVAGTCVDCHEVLIPVAQADYLQARAHAELRLQGEHPAIHGPAGADWREPAPERGHYWTGDSATWLCTCGAGRPEACTCSQANGSHQS